MRHRLPLLALAAAVAASSLTGAAFAAWSPGYAAGPWDAVTVAEAGELWVNKQDVAYKRTTSWWERRRKGLPDWVWEEKKSGTVPLYKFKETGRKPNPNNQGTAISFDGWKSEYSLVLNGSSWKVVKAGNPSWSAVPQGERFFQAPGTYYVVREGTGAPPDQRPTTQPAPGKNPTAKKPAGKKPTGKAPTRKAPTRKTPTGKTPTGKTPTGDQKPADAVVDLTPRELTWLTLKQRSDYKAAVSAAKEQSAHLQTNKQYRDIILNTNLRKEAVPAYQAATSAKLSSAAIEDALDPAKVKPYDGWELALNDEELGLLEQITKDKAPAGVTIRGANAKADYLEEKRLADVEKDADGSIDRVARHLVAQKYRDLYAKAGKKPTKDPATAGTGGQTPTDTKPQKPANGDLTAALTDAERALLSDSERAAYDKEIADAKGDAAKIAAINKAWRVKIGAKNHDYFVSQPALQRDICNSFKSGVAAKTSRGGAQCDDLADVLNGSSSCEKKYGGPADGATAEIRSQKQAESKRAVSQCLERVQACQTGGVAATPSAIPEQYRKECGDIEAGASPVPPPGGHSDLTAKAPPAPTASGSDNDTEPKKKSDPAFYRNLATGMTMGVFGMVLGSFFGGPVLFLGVGLALGAGAFFLSRHFNKPKD